MTGVPSNSLLSPTAPQVYYAKLSGRRCMVYGYIIEWDLALERGKNIWNTAEALQSLVDSIELSYVVHMKGQCREHWPRTCLRPVKFRGMIYSCIALADNIAEWHGAGKKIPPAEVIGKIKKLLETDDEPKWYTYYG